MAIFTELDDRDLSIIAAEFDLGRVRASTAIEGGTINSNYALDTERGRFFLRINEGKTERDVRYEAALVAALADAGVPTPRPLSTRAGEPVLVLRRAGEPGVGETAETGASGASGARPARLLRLLINVFPWIPGEHPTRLDAAHTRALGRTLAQLHVAGLPLAAAFERVGMYSFEDIRARVRALDGHGDPVLAPALQLVDDEIRWLEARTAIRRAASQGVIHNDLFPDNVFFADHELCAVIDFEQASTGSLCYDLAVCINAWCVDDSPDPADDAGSILAVERMRALVAGYSSVRALTRGDRDALAIELRAAAMRFTVTRITDVYLPGLDKPDRDFRHFLHRLIRWRAEIDVWDLLERADSRK